MAFLYVLCEGDRDDLFFDRLCERAAGQAFERGEEFRLRPGSNFKTALADARLLLNRVRKWTAQQEIAVVIAIDNDRAPGHPGAKPSARKLGKADLKKEPRHPVLVKRIEGALGADRAKWPVDVGVAMPVEMIESWVLLLHNPARPALPLFAKASQRCAREYHGGTDPPQLKDLRDAEAKAQGVTVEEFFFNAAGSEHLAAAESASPSLAMFLEEVREWRCVKKD